MTKSFFALTNVLFWGYLLYASFVRDSLKLINYFILFFLIGLFVGVSLTVFFMLNEKQNISLKKNKINQEVH